MSSQINSAEVGVVVIGRNEGDRLLRCLASIGSESLGRVYVDSGSTDDSVAAARRLGWSVVSLDSNQPFTAARGRNEGFVALRVERPDIEFVQFIDGDCELIPGWLNAALKFMTVRKDVAVVCGRRRECRPELSIYNELCEIEWNTPVGESSACGGDSLVRVQAFEEVAGFRSQLIAGEEPELCIRLRERAWKIWRLDADMTRHDAAMTRFAQWWLRAVRSGYGYAEVFRLHRHSPFRIWTREVVRAVIWGGLIPAGLVLGSLVHPAALAGALIYTLQICRIAVRRGASRPQSWTYAVFMTLAKFAEFQGVLKFGWQRWRRESYGPIEYKRAE